MKRERTRALEHCVSGMGGWGAWKRGALEAWGPQELLKTCWQSTAKLLLLLPALVRWMTTATPSHHKRKVRTPATPPPTYQRRPPARTQGHGSCEKAAGMGGTERGRGSAGRGREGGRHGRRGGGTERGMERGRERLVSSRLSFAT